MKKTIQAQFIARFARSCAQKTFTAGERYGGLLNRTTYPNRWFGALEAQRGVLNAASLGAFRDAYTHRLAELTVGKKSTTRANNEGNNR